MLSGHLKVNEHGAPQILLQPHGNLWEPQHPTEPDKHAFMCYDGVGVYSSLTHGVICTTAVPDEAALADFDRLVGPEIADIRAATAGLLVGVDRTKTMSFSIWCVDLAVGGTYLGEIRQRIQIAAAESKPSFRRRLDPVKHASAYV